MHSRVIGGDDFIASLWDVHLKVKNEGCVQVCPFRPRGNPGALLTVRSPYRSVCSGQTTWFTKRTKEQGGRRVLRR